MALKSNINNNLFKTFKHLIFRYTQSELKLYLKDKILNFIILTTMKT